MRLTALILPSAIAICVIVTVTEIDPRLVTPAFLLLVAAHLWRGSRVLTRVGRRALARAPLRRLRAVLAVDETVLAEAIGWDRGVLRLIACTSRRVLVVTSSRTLVDAPYQDVTRVGIEWKLGKLTVTAGGRTHRIDSVAKAELLPLARALEQHGVESDRPAPRRRLLDEAAMATAGFDRGLWLLLAATAALVYLDPFGRELSLIVLGAVAVGCGHTAGTRSALAYLAPVNVLLAPGLFFVGTYDVIVVMLLVSAVTAAGLLTGVALRRGSAAAGGGGRGLRVVEVSRVALLVVAAVIVVSAQVGVNLKWAVDEALATHLPVDGRSDLTGGAASITYTPGAGLKEVVTDEDWGAGPNDGARWELRSALTDGDNVVSLAHYVFDDPRLDDPAAVAEFVADKDAEHTRMAGSPVTHTERVVDGRTGYVWEHPTRRGYWAHAEWFPHPVHTIRLECVARKQLERFRRLCAEARRSLTFN